ncbi:S-adenosyl-L-methionine-dependent methyltransferase [Xylaria scruposa]|nr:S-adenosyl-L-methionine-dependent methyltransferase [Xylaria scruposa]
MASHSKTPLARLAEEADDEEPNELVQFPSSHRAPLARIAVETEDEELSEVIPFPRRQSPARRPGLSVKSSPVFIEPFLNRGPYDPGEFTKFLDPYLMDGNEVLHLGCQDGGITFALCSKVLPTGHVFAINSPGRDTSRAKQMARTINFEDNITFLDISNLTRLPFGDDTFDVVYASDLMVHLPPGPEHEVAVRVLAEMKRVARPGGIIACRDLAAQHFFPNHDLIDMVTRTLFKASGLTGWYGPIMPTLYSRVGLRSVITCSTSSPEGPAVGETNWAEKLVNLLAEGTEVRKAWIGAGVHVVIIDLISDKLKNWGKLIDSWYVCLYAETMAQKPKSASPASPASPESADPSSPEPAQPSSHEPAADSDGGSSTSTVRPRDDNTSDLDVHIGGVHIGGVHIGGDDSAS